jgi:hypothetical protein
MFEKMNRLLMTSPDHLRLNNGDCDVGRVPGVVSLAGCLSLLLGEGLPESRALDNPAFGNCNDDSVHSAKVTAVWPYNNWI